MSVEKVREYLTPYGVADRMREFEVSSATVELAKLRKSLILPKTQPALSNFE